MKHNKKTKKKKTNKIKSLQTEIWTGLVDTPFYLVCLFFFYFYFFFFLFLLFPLIQLEISYCSSEIYKFLPMTQKLQQKHDKVKHYNQG